MRITIIGAGNLGTAMADGLVKAGSYRAEDIALTRRSIHLLAAYRDRGFAVMPDNREGVAHGDVLIVAVEPQQVDAVLAEIAPALDPERHVLISVVTGVSCSRIQSVTGSDVPVVRAMPNTAISIHESMTCLASANADERAFELAKSIFDAVGTTIVIKEELMAAATALGACGIAFFLRAIRAASQGGIEIGFHAADALKIAAQTARGAATLLLAGENHPEFEIDRVTTPRGCTIAGLNRMEHEGFSSAMIKGITLSAEMAAGLYEK
jgi:pyrroline-5-carboxylate reductase